MPVSDVLPSAVRTELDRIAAVAATCIVGLPANARLIAMALLCQRIAEETNQSDEIRMSRQPAPAAHTTPSLERPHKLGEHEAETSTGPHSLPEELRPVPVPPEVVAEAIRTFDEKEVLEAIHEIHQGRGRKLEEFLEELEKAAMGQDTVR